MPVHRGETAFFGTGKGGGRVSEYHGTRLGDDRSPNHGRTQSVGNVVPAHPKTGTTVVNTGGGVLNFCNVIGWGLSGRRVCPPGPGLGVSNPPPLSGVHCGVLPPD